MDQNSEATDPNRDLETREVKVDEPGLTPRTNARLTEEVREVIGARKVTVPRDREHPSQGEERQHRSALSLATNNWLMIAIGAASALVVAAVVGTAATGSWWLVAAAFLLDVIGLAVVAFVVIGMTRVTERPDPTIVAAMEQEGVAAPEEHFSRLVDEFRDVDTAEGEDRSANVIEDPAVVAEEQRSTGTPTSGPSRAVGP